MRQNAFGDLVRLVVTNVLFELNAEVKGGSAASEGGTEVPHSRGIAAVSVRTFLIRHRCGNNGAVSFRIARSIII